jgi:hypothetical protein
MFGKMQRGGNFLKHRKFFKNSENAPSYSNYFLKSVENLFSLWWGRGEKNAILHPTVLLPLSPLLVFHK